MKINIMGHAWTLERKTVEQEPLLKDCDGFTDWTTRRIVVIKKVDGATIGNWNEYDRKVARREIVHAFLYESGLAFSSLPSSNWAVNEEMVDWFAFKGPDIVKAWENAGVREG